MSNTIVQRNSVLSILNSAKRLSFSYRSIVSSNPAFWLFYQPYIWWGKKKMNARGINAKERVVRPNTELVIDGFQGSANSFATEAFKENQSRQVELSHHMHSPTQIIQAIDQNVPVILTLRDPVGAVLSLTSRWSHLTVTQGLHSYIRFYSQLEPYVSHCVITSFDVTTNHLDRVIDRVNQKFSTNFDVVDMVRVRENYAKFQAETGNKNRANRKSIKQRKKAEFSTAKNSALLEQAEVIYQKLQAHSQKSFSK